MLLFFVYVCIVIKTIKMDKKESNFNKLMSIQRKDTDPQDLNKEQSVCNVVFGEVPKSAIFCVGQHGIRVETNEWVFFERNEDVSSRFSKEDCLFISMLVQRMFDVIVEFIDGSNIEIIDKNKL